MSAACHEQVIGFVRTYALIAALVLPGIGAHTLPAPNPVAGYVAELSGHWYIAGHANAPLRVGAYVRGGDVVRGEPSPDATGVIGIVLRTGVVLSAAYGAQTPGSVAVKRDSLIVPRDAAPHSWFTRAIDGVMKQLRLQEPGEFVSLVSRGMALDDAVVPLRAGRLDLRSTLAPLDSATYRVCLTRVMIGDGASTDPEAEDRCDAEIAYDWHPHRPGSVPAAGLRPGLYMMRTEVEGESVNAWVLVSDSHDYPRRSVAYARMVRASRAWQATLSADARRQILRAYLAELMIEKPASPASGTL